jgi:hypothetical protein
VDNNISALSSGGFTQLGGTVDLVAPGDLNWALCDPDPAQYSSCTNLQGDAASPIELQGGTSESSPLTAGAAADVYADVEVANPPAGTWTAVFFTEQDSATPGGVGTSGTFNGMPACTGTVRATRSPPPRCGSRPAAGPRPTSS